MKNERNYMAIESVLAKNLEKITSLKEYVEVNMVNRPYHNFAHALDAARAYQDIGRWEKLSLKEMFMGTSAMIIHDLISVPLAKDNEEQTIEKANEILPAFGYNRDEVEQISKIIYTTKLGVEPNGLLEQIAKDSDLDNLGREDFFYRSESLRQEFGVENKSFWLKTSLEFLMKHKYCTETSKRLRGEGLALNIYRLKKMIEAG